MFYFILLFICALLIFYKYFNCYSDYWKKRNLVQVNDVIQRFLSAKCSLSEVFKKVYDKYSNEKYIGIFLAKPAVIIRDTQDVQAVLQDFQNFYSRGLVINPEDTLGNNILFMDDYERWRLIRHKISPVFTSRKLKKIFHIMDKCSRDFMAIDNILQHIETDSFYALSVLTTSCIAATTFGVESKTKNAMESPFLDMVKAIVQPSLFNNLKFSLANFSPFLFKCLKLKVFGKFEKFFIGMFQNVLENRRQSNKLRYDFVDTCIELQKKGIIRDNDTGFEMEPSDEILAAQAFLFFLAGVDTSATTMHFILLELANNPKVLSKLHREIDEVFNKYGDTLTYEAIDDMQYLEMILNETTRKYPPIGSIQRRCTHSTVLPSGNFQIEKDEIVVIPILALHRDAQNFPNPNLFDPQRFAPESFINIKKFTYLPFGEGNRICLGARFARLQVKCGIAWILRKHTLKEQKYNPTKFDNSPFSVKDKNAKIKLVSRDATPM